MLPVKLAGRNALAVQAIPPAQPVVLLNRAQHVITGHAVPCHHLSALLGHWVRKGSLLLFAARIDRRQPPAHRQISYS